MSQAPILPAPTLELHYKDRLVATLGDKGLIYDRQWSEDPSAFPLSQTLPKGSTPFDREIAWRWLVNLLPEGDARKRITARLQLSQDNDLALLRALGNDCAGAIRIRVQDENEAPSPPKKSARYRRLQDEQLERLADQPGAVATLLGQDIRLSLAGAQDKIPLRRCKDDSLWLPLDHAPSTHLLKCPNPSFSHLVLNEYFCLQLAKAVGLNVAESSIFQSPQGRWLLLLERFDRSPTELSPAPDPQAQECELPWVDRLHQEDFAQALGHPHYEKYEAEGGPTFADCIALVRKSARRPVLEILPLIRWLAYCLIIGNRDNHAKNLARLYQNGHWTLAPFYDLVCTRAYRALASTLAMTIGQERDIARLTPQVWTAQAKQAGIGARMLIAEVQDMTQKVQDEIEPLQTRLVSEYKLDPSALTPVIRAIQKGNRATQRSVYT